MRPYFTQSVRRVCVHVCALIAYVNMSMSACTCLKCCVCVCVTPDLGLANIFSHLIKYAYLNTHSQLPPVCFTHSDPHTHRSLFACNTLQPVDKKKFDFPLTSVGRFGKWTLTAWLIELN